MNFDPHKHHRRSIRLKGYDYSQPGAYFVTIVTHQRQEIFGQIRSGEMRLSPLGEIVARAWIDLPRHFNSISLDAFVIMPNHVHGIMIIHEQTVRAGLQEKADPKAGQDSGMPRFQPHTGKTRPYPTRCSPALPEIVRAFKSFSARRINTRRGTPGTPVWQRNYYEHIIRNQVELDAIRLYIQSNPAMWEDDAENIGVQAT